MKEKFLISSTDSSLVWKLVATHTSDFNLALVSLFNLRTFPYDGTLEFFD